MRRPLRSYAGTQEAPPTHKRELNDLIMNRFKHTSRALLVWCLFIGLGAVFGSTMMFIKTDGSIMGMQTLLPYFQVLPFADILFQDYLFSGFALLIVNGLTNLTAAVLIIRHKKLGIILGGVFGVTLMLWITIQFIIFPCNFLSSIYFVFGALQAATGFAAWVFYRQEHFEFNADDYPNIGKDGRGLVVFFSRMGYTKKVAYQIANASGAELVELKTPEPTACTSGFFWCGRFALQRRPMPITEINLPLESYESVTICTPVWVFSVSAPVRSFCLAAKGRVTSVNLVLVHNCHLRFNSVIREMSVLLGCKPKSARSICCKWGKYFSDTELIDAAKE